MHPQGRAARCYSAAHGAEPEPALPAPSAMAMTDAPHTRRVFRILVLLLCWALLLPEHLYLPWSGLPVDPNWQLVLHHALSQGWIFGRDIVFTHGPLGFLEERAPVGGARGAYLVSDLVIHGLLLALLVSALRRLRGPGPQLLLVLACFAFGAYRSPPSLALLVLGLSVFAVFLYLESGHIRHLAWAGALAVAAFHLKANTGIVVGVLFASVLAVEIAFSERRRALAALTGAWVLLFGASLVILPIAPLGYLRAFVHYVAAYPDAMGLATPGSERFAALAIVELAAAAALVLIHRRVLLADRRQALITVLVGCGLFVLFRQGFVRADQVPRHIPTFFQFSLLFVGLWFLFAREPLRRGVAYLFVTALAFSIVSQPGRFTPRHLADKVQGIARYARQALADGIPAELGPPPQRDLPASFRARIGDAPMDIMSYESAQPIREGLDYHPRPVFQSYAAIDPYLDQLNVDALAAPGAAEFIVFNGTAIDKRYAFFDETRTKLALLRDFRVAEARREVILLERSPHPREIVRTPLRTGRARLGDALSIPRSDGLVSLVADIDYSIEGRLVSFLFRPPALALTFVLENGRRLTYRLPRAAVRDGILVSPYVATQPDAGLFFAGRFDELSAVRSVTIRSPFPNGFAEWFPYRLTRLALEDPIPDPPARPEPPADRPGPGARRSERSSSAGASAPAPSRAARAASAAAEG